jgi:hypothetical protein
VRCQSEQLALLARHGISAEQGTGATDRTSQKGARDDAWDRQPEPAYVSYQITGWVPSAVLTQRHRRHFFTPTTTEATPERQKHSAEQVLRFTLFWTPHRVLPALRSGQAAWLAVFRAYRAAQENGQESD